MTPSLQKSARTGAELRRRILLVTASRQFHMAGWHMRQKRASRSALLKSAPLKSAPFAKEPNKFARLRFASFQIVPRMLTLRWITGCEHAALCCKMRQYMAAQNPLQRCTRVHYSLVELPA